MKKQTFWYSSLFITIFILTLILFYWFFKSPYFLVVDNWTKENKLLYIVYLFIYKSVSVLFPPIPAGLVTMASIPFLGWFNAYLVDFFGSMFGGVIAYFLGRKYGHPLLLKILGEDVTNKIEKIKIKKIGFKNFLIGSILSHVAVGIPSFFLANNILNGQNIILTIILTIVGLIFIFYTKGRYFE